MNKKLYRFKKQFFDINGIYNIPGIVICSGFGLCFETHCCKNCGEIFVLDLELLYYKKININNLIEGKQCPNCFVDLNSNLVKYPENIFHNGKLLQNAYSIDLKHFENSELLEVYELE